MSFDEWLERYTTVSDEIVIASMRFAWEAAVKECVRRAEAATPRMVVSDGEWVRGAREAAALIIGAVKGE